MFDLTPLPFPGISREELIDIFNWTIRIEDDEEHDTDVLVYYFMQEPVAYGSWVAFDRDHLDEIVEDPALDGISTVERGELTKEEEEELTSIDPSSVVTFLHLRGITTSASQVEDIYVKVPLFNSEVEVLHFMVEYMIGMHGLENEEDIALMDT